MAEFLKSTHVSRETISKLEQYLALLVKWQRAVNLVSSKTLSEAWERHFVDSAQLLPLIPDHVKAIADIGSGAGFPGLVIAVLRPDIEVSLIESDMKKCQFMRTVIRELGLKNVRVINKRIEAAHGDVSPDMVSARALSSLSELLGYVEPWRAANSDLCALFLKGGKADEEVEEALRSYDFAAEKFASDTSDEGCVLRLTNISLISP